MSATLWRASLRYLFRYPWLFALSVLGIALGVGVVVSVDLANMSARRAFTLSAESITGRATHHVIGGSKGIPESLYKKIRVEAAIRDSAPIVEGYASAIGHGDRAFTLLGVDPFAEYPFRPYLQGMGEGDGDLLPQFLTRPRAVILSEGTAREMNLKTGDRLVISARGFTTELEIIAILRAGDKAGARRLDDLLITDIATAQEILSLEGTLSRVDLIVPEGRERESILAELNALLPPGAEIVRAGLRTRSFEQLTRAFNLNLTALSLLALLVGMFLIYNTVTFTVLRRRGMIGTLRTLGVTRREVFTLILGEALLTGILGTGIGLAIGVIMGKGLLFFVTRTINDLYFVVTVRQVEIEYLSLAKGFAIGLAATLLSTLLPAREATTSPPGVVLARSSIESRVRRSLPRLSLLGLFFLLLGAGLLNVPGEGIVIAHAAFFSIIIGFAFLTPACTVAVLGLVGPLMRSVFGIIGAMAARSVSGALSRTSVAIAALMVAVSATVGVGIMVESFRETFIEWLEVSLQSDIHVSPARRDSRYHHFTLPRRFIERVAETPGVEAVNRYRVIRVESSEGLTYVAVLDVKVQGFRGLRFKEGEAGVAWRDFQENGAVILSEPYAYRHGLHVGSLVNLKTDVGRRDFPVAGVIYDYTSDQGAVVISRKSFEKHWNDRGVTSLGVFAAAGTDLDSLTEALRGLDTGGQEVVIRPHWVLKRESLEVFDRTFVITAVLRLLAVIVAFVGVVSALMALQIARGREFGILRACGLTPRQGWGLILCETGLIGGIAGLLSIPVGLVQALIMVYVINVRSFGWTFKMVIDPGILLQALLLALGAALVSGIYPAVRIGRMRPVSVLREE
jgi:putative ABC transport system permease protein